MMRVLILPQLYCEECRCPLIVEFRGTDLHVEHPQSEHSPCGQNGRSLYISLTEFRKELA